MKINEIFYSIQGEGYWTGTPSVFIRFSGCNQSCDFCDTQFKEGKEMSAEEVANVVRGYPCKRVVLTGGEPCLQLSRELLGCLHGDGCYIQMETNGSVDIGNMVYSVDWVTCSKKSMPVKLKRIDEVKRVMLDTPPVLEGVENHAKWFFVQPMDTGDVSMNGRAVSNVVEFVKNNPKWRISLQTHKILNVR